MSWKAARPWYLIAFTVLLIDQISKHWIESLYDHGHSMPVTPFFNLVLTYNPGAAFSFLADAGGWQRHLFTGLALVVSVVLIWLLPKHHHEKRLAWAMSLILGGALGNAIDRIVFGHVIDFLDFYVGRYHWPAFNLADTAICIGAFLLILDSFWKPQS